MKKLLAFLLVCSLVLVTTGCPSPTTKSTKVETTATTKPDKVDDKKVVVPKDATLTVKADDAKVKLGEKVKVTVKVERKDFAADEEVTLTFAPPPDSKIKVADATVAKDKKEAEVMVDVDKEAKAGDYTIEVNAVSLKVKAMGKFKVTVTDK